jgi:hypothetical protein
VQESLALGAFGVVKDARTADLFPTFRSVLAGDFFVSLPVAR